MASFASSGLRRGKWTAEEEAYATRVILAFKEGLLDVARGTSLRSYLSDKLNCAPMRITKKFAGDASIRRSAFHPREDASPAMIERSRREIAELEEAWRRKLGILPGSSHTTSSAAGHRKRARADSDDSDEDEVEETEKEEEDPRHPLISEDMAAVVGVSRANHFRLVKLLWKYIKAHDLQNPSKRTEILCDEKLKKVFKRDKVTSFGMSKLLAAHIYKDGDPRATKPEAPKKTKKKEDDYGDEDEYGYDYDHRMDEWEDEDDEDEDDEDEDEDEDEYGRGYDHNWEKEMEEEDENDEDEEEEDEEEEEEDAIPFEEIAFCVDPYTYDNSGLNVVERERFKSIRTPRCDGMRISFKTPVRKWYDIGYFESGDVVRSVFFGFQYKLKDKNTLVELGLDPDEFYKTNPYYNKDMIFPYGWNWHEVEYEDAEHEWDKYEADEERQGECLVRFQPVNGDLPIYIYELRRKPRKKEVFQMRFIQATLLDHLAGKTLGTRYVTSLSPR